jgi:hypothetical protein
MKFSQRLGYVPQKAIQLHTMDNDLRNRLFNLFQRLFPMSSLDLGFDTGYDETRGFILDKLGINIEYTAPYQNSTNNQKFDKVFLEGEWYRPYDILEFCLEYETFRFYESRARKINRLKYICNEIKLVLEEEKSGYRLLNNQFVPITSDIELGTLKDATLTKYQSVNTHMRKAIALYSDRKSPDYENAIKEAISALEALCCSITGENVTLAKALDRIEQKGVNIHPAQKEAFKKLYGYTSDENGIRHGGMDFKNVPSEDAKYMIVVCSAFINYLLEKLSKLEGNSR